MGLSPNYRHPPRPTPCSPPATSTPPRSKAAVAATHVRIAVYDGGDQLPPPRRPDAEEEGGRGLFLVTALSDVCGVTPASTGKGVWFQLNR
ncbi:ATP-binding protein [Streptomyces sp. NPDC018029]|uniref:ATP-binding protein n=1 Tax=Streptomyces sp. NPDC018029 TaxID=3365032 RepID=UPI0037AC88CF